MVRAEVPAWKAILISQIYYIAFVLWNMQWTSEVYKSQDIIAR